VKSEDRCWSLEVGPHPEDLYRTVRVQNLIDQAMLDVDPARVSSFEVTDQFLEGWRALSRIAAEDLQEFLRFFAKSASREFPSVFLGLPRKDQPPTGCGLYQPGFSDVLLIGVRSPFRIDSRMPGIESR
jgi:hypothetical protein